MISLSRAPASADFLLPRRAAYWWFEGFIRAQQTPGLRSAISWAALLLAGAGLAAWIAALARELAAWDPAARTLRRFLLCAAAVLGTAWAGRWALSLFLEISSSAWFPPESLDWREPALAFLAANHAAWGVFGASTVFCRAAGAARTEDSRGMLRRFFSRLVILVLPASLLCAIGVFRDDLGKNNLEARRRLYRSLTLELEPTGLREALASGLDRGDPLARLLLLRNLSRAPASPENLAALRPLADPLRWRIGPAASMLLAEASGHFGDAPGAAALRSSAGRGGIPPGLLAGLEDRAPGPAAGVGRGAFRGIAPRRAALFVREPGPDGDAIDPAGLVAAAAPNAKGRFEFKGLPDGDYFLALSPPSGGIPERAVGAPGDIRLKEGRRRVELKPIEVR